MNRTIQSVCIVTKAGHLEAMALADTMKAWFELRGCWCDVFENGKPGWRSAILARGNGAVLVLGGDGTLLSVARRLVNTNVPVLGVNMGRVGFLTEVAMDSWESQLERLLDGRARLVRRLALSCMVERQGYTVFSGVAVNDLVVHRGALARVIRLDLSVDDEPLGGLRADGLIVSTPVGATGYAVSASGPLLHPDLDAYSVTPICPFMNALRPFVLSGHMVLTVHVGDTDTDLYLTQDGQEGVVLKAGDKITVSRAAQGTLFADLGSASYFTRLRTRGFYKDQQ